MRNDPRMIICRADAERIWRLIGVYEAAADPDVLDRLEVELGRARVVDDEDLPREVVTMGARVAFEDLEVGRRREVMLVYPEEANIAELRVSVLSAVGSALLGLAPGQEISWPMAKGRLGRLRVLEVHPPVTSIPTTPPA
jgi:regulator of nucleoside diphosphate kinase